MIVIIKVVYFNWHKYLEKGNKSSRVEGKRTQTTRFVVMRSASL
jgi:hypothetical protein